MYHSTAAVWQIAKGGTPAVWQIPFFLARPPSPAGGREDPRAERRILVKDSEKTLVPCWVLYDCCMCVPPLIDGLPSLTPIVEGRVGHPVHRCVLWKSRVAHQGEDAAGGLGW